jgi:methylmalonyl-CoA/ethylmalonyl-CoA epimerase
VATDRVEVAVFVLGPSRVELLTATDPASTVYKFLERRGEALHHLAYAVSDVRAALRQAEDAGAQLIDREPRPGAGGKLVAFIHPKGAHGVLTELVQIDGG